MTICQFEMYDSSLGSGYGVFVRRASCNNTSRSNPTASSFPTASCCSTVLPSASSCSTSSSCSTAPSCSTAIWLHHCHPAAHCIQLPTAIQLPISIQLPQCGSVTFIISSGADHRSLSPCNNYLAFPGEMLGWGCAKPSLFASFHWLVMASLEDRRLNYLLPDALLTTSSSVVSPTTGRRFPSAHLTCVLSMTSRMAPCASVSYSLAAIISKLKLSTIWVAASDWLL